jgi:Lsr2
VSTATSPCRSRSAIIEARNLVKRYGSAVAVNDLSFSIRPGLVTGFLGPRAPGSQADGTVRFALDGTEYEIDLSAEHAGALRERWRAMSVPPGGPVAVPGGPPGEHAGPR